MWILVQECVEGKQFVGLSIIVLYAVVQLDTAETHFHIVVRHLHHLLPQNEGNLQEILVSHLHVVNMRIVDKSEIVLAAHVNKTISEVHQTVDQSVLPVRSVQVIWLVSTTNALTLVQEVVGLTRNVMLSTISPYARV